jgi:hypothetical protein
MLGSDSETAGQPKRSRSALCQTDRARHACTRRYFKVAIAGRWSLQAIRERANSLGTESLGHALRKGPPRTRRGAISAVDRHNEATAAMAAPGTPLAQEPLAQAGRGASRDPYAKAVPRREHARVPRGSCRDSCCSAYLIKEGPSGLDLLTPLGPGRHAFLPAKSPRTRREPPPAIPSACCIATVPHPCGGRKFMPTPTAATTPLPR